MLIYTLGAMQLLVRSLYLLYLLAPYSITIPAQLSHACPKRSLIIQKKGMNLVHYCRPQARKLLTEGRKMEAKEDKESGLEGLRKLRALSDLGAEEVDEVDEGAEAKGNESDGCHGPGGAHVLEHQDAQMRERGGHDETRDEEGGDCASGNVWIGVYSFVIIRLCFVIWRRGKGEGGLPVM